jgi:hypothetical protein
MKQFSSAFLAAILWFTPHLHADVEMTTQEFFFIPESTDKFIDVVDSLAKMCSSDEYIVKSESPETLCFNIDVYPDYYLVRASKKSAVSRNYNILVTAEEKKDIHFILTTLAKSSLASLATSKSSLNKAGDRIDHIHPFRFLTVVFTDEVLKASVNAIRSRSWVWDQFFDGLHRSLKEESQKNNLTAEQINEFTALIGISSAPVQNIVNNRRWKELINYLIDTIPRTGNPNFYDM